MRSEYYLIKSSCILNTSITIRRKDYFVLPLHKKNPAIEEYKIYCWILQESINMNGPTRDLPWGLRCSRCMCNGCCEHRRVNWVAWHQGSILALTYLAYTCYHLTRKPISVVKNVLSLNCSNLPVPADIFINASNRDTWCDWAPFGKER